MSNSRDELSLNQGDENAQQSKLLNDPDLSSARIGLILGKVPNTLTEYQSLYRGDTRDFSHVFNHGFTARGTNTDLLLHAMPPGEPYLIDSAYISTSMSKEMAATFPKPPPPGINYSYVYEIHTEKPTINVGEELAIKVTQGQVHTEDLEILKLEQEKAVPLRIQPSEIKGGWEVGITKEVIDEYDHEYSRFIRKEFFHNPNYIPPAYPEKRLWNTGRSLGRLLTGVGLVLDGTNLYREYQHSSKSGDYSNTYREGARIVGGWTGAYATGTLFAEIGATSCLPFTPYASAACGIVGGFAGSVIGYYGGSIITTRIYDVNKSQSSLLTSSNIPLHANIDIKLKEFNEVLRLDPEEKTYQASSKLQEIKNKKAVEHCDKGLAIFYKKDYQGALKEVNEAIRLNPTYADAYCLRGSCYKDTGKFKEALVEFNQSINFLSPNNPKFAYFYYHRADAYNKLNEPKNALNDINKFLEIFPDISSALAIKNEAQKKQAMVHFQHGCNLFEKKDYKNALKEFNEAIFLNVNYVDAHCAKGSCHREMGDFQAAITSYNEAVRIDPKYLLTYYHRSIVYSKLNNYQQALVDANKILEYDNKNALALIAKTEYKNKFLELAHKKLIEATKINDLKKMTEALDEGADINALSEEGAVCPQWKATALHAAAIFGRTQAVELLISRGANINAICNCGTTPLHQAASRNTHTDIVHKLITLGADPATVRDIAKHNPITNAYFEKLLAAQSLAHFQRGCELFEQKKDYLGALKEANEAIRLNPNYAEAYCLRGSCYRETGKLQEAVAAYNFAINLNPKYPWSYYNRSITYTKLNEHQKALNDANKFLEICPGNASGIAMRNAAQSKLQPKPQAVIQPKPAVAPPTLKPTTLIPWKLGQPKPVAQPKLTLTPFTFLPKKTAVQPKPSVVPPKLQFDLTFLQKKSAVAPPPKPPAVQPKPVVNSSTVHLNSATAMANDVSKRVQAEQDKWRQEQDRKYREQLAREQREREERTRQEAKQRMEQERRHEEERKRAHQQHMDYLHHLNKTSTAFGKPSIGQASGGGFFSSSSNKLDCIYPSMGVNGSNGSMGRFCRQGNAPYYTYNNPSTGKPW